MGAVPECASAVRWASAGCEIDPAYTEPWQRSPRATGNLHRTLFRVGVISDTHGLLRPQALAFLRGCDRIIHAGDIGDPEILRELSALAPLTAVRGNNDKGVWAESLPETEFVLIEEALVHVLHDRAQLDMGPRIAGVRVVVSGHSHRPLIEKREGVLYVNPGSAGPRRFKLPIAVAELTVVGKSVTARIVKLDV